MRTAEKTPRCSCSFCGKGNHEVFLLLTCGRAFICDECVEICHAAVAEKRAAAAADKAASP
jgi:ATP-dependent Clp protease ATP-binding subunit ClpX